MLDEKGKVEREVVAMKRALCFFLAIVFVCCVIVHGENKRFSVEVMITNLTNFQDMPSLLDITECWTLDYYMSTEVNEDGVSVEVPVYYDNYDGSNEVVKGLYSMVAFFKRVGRTVKIVIDMIICVFGNLKYLLPWNSTVST